ncbi:MAG: hypothetical protein MHM6MM_000127 [Cercozoa sp. M6MM]
MELRQFVCTDIEACPNKKLHSRGEDAGRITSFLAASECQQLIEAAEAQNGARLLPLDDEYPSQYRSGHRFLTMAPEFADVMWNRLTESLTDFEQTQVRPFGRKGSWRPCGLNPLLRVTRYSPGDKFSAHRDAPFVATESITSAMTLLVYLNTIEEGGRTVFWGQGVTPNDAELHSPPIHFERAVCGDAVVFPHDKVHAGEEVPRETKYILRCDILYQQVGRLKKNSLDELDARDSKHMHELFSESIRLVNEGDAEGSTNAFRDAVELRAKLPSSDQSSSSVTLGLSSDVLQHMVAFLNDADVAACARTCRHWARALTTDASALWKRRFYQRFPDLYHLRVAMFARERELSPWHGSKALFEDWHSAYAKQVRSERCLITSTFFINTERREFLTLSNSIGNAVFADFGARTMTCGSVFLTQDQNLVWEAVRALINAKEQGEDIAQEEFAQRILREVARDETAPHTECFHDTDLDHGPPYHHLTQPERLRVNTKLQNRSAQRCEVLHERARCSGRPTSLHASPFNARDLEQLLQWHQGANGVSDAAIRRSLNIIERGVYFRTNVSRWQDSVLMQVPPRVMPSITARGRYYSHGTPFYHEVFGQYLIYKRPEDLANMRSIADYGWKEPHEIDFAQLQISHSLLMRKKFGRRSVLHQLSPMGGAHFDDNHIEKLCKVIPRSQKIGELRPIIVCRPWFFSTSQVAEYCASMMLYDQDLAAPAIAVIDPPVLVSLASGFTNSVVVHVSPSIACVALVRNAEVVDMREWKEWREVRKLHVLIDNEHLVHGTDFGMYEAARTTDEAIENFAYNRPRLECNLPEDVMRAFAQFANKMVECWRPERDQTVPVVVSGGVTLTPGFDAALADTLKDVKLVTPEVAHRLRATYIGAQLFVSRSDADEFFVDLPCLISQMEFLLENSPAAALFSKYNDLIEMCLDLVDKESPTQTKPACIPHLRFSAHASTGRQAHR